MPDEIPTFTIDARDPHFTGLLKHMVLFTAAQLDLTPEERETRVAGLEALIERGRQYQVEQGKRKPELEKKRQWATIKS